MRQLINSVFGDNNLKSYLINILWRFVDKQLLVGQYLLVQSQQHKRSMWNPFKFNHQDTRTSTVTDFTNCSVSSLKFKERR